MKTFADFNRCVTKHYERITGKRASTMDYGTIADAMAILCKLYDLSDEKLYRYWAKIASDHRKNRHVPSSEYLAEVCAAAHAALEELKIYPQDVPQIGESRSWGSRAAAMTRKFRKVCV